MRRCVPLLAVPLLPACAGALLFALFLPSMSAAQLPAPGARVRVTSPALQLNDDVGIFRSALADTLLVRLEATPGEELRIPVASLTRPEIRARKGNGWNGAGLGALAGGVAGVVASLTGG